MFFILVLAASYRDRANSGGYVDLDESLLTGLEKVRWYQIRTDDSF